MKNKFFDMALIAVLGLLLAVLDHFDLLARYAHFALIPMISIYFVGIWVGKKRV